MPAGSSGCWQDWGSSCGFGDRSQIKAKRVRHKKTDRLDAELLLQLRRWKGEPSAWFGTGFASYVDGSLNMC